MDLPLCVDLDGTVIRTDLLWETLARLVKTKPWLLFFVPFWLVRGRAELKCRLAGQVELDVGSLPYDEPFLDFLRSERARGRRVLLVTASDQTLARAVSKHLGLFDEVMASDGLVNLKSGAKAAALVARFGPQGFDYAGDSSADLAVWVQARGAILVGASRSVALRARKLVAVAKEFPRTSSRVAALVRLLRPHQWVKNLLIFVPLVTSHQLGQPKVAWLGVAGFVAFCFSASSVYVVNDLLDVEADRRHPSKRRRPLASGAVPLWQALVLGPVLLAVGVGLAALVSKAFLAVLVVYLAVSSCYSWRLKQIPLLDVFILAGLYTLRVIAGHAAARVEYSAWLLAFAMFIFLSLALVKRFQELRQASLGGEGAGVTRARGYDTRDIPLLTPFGAASGYLAALVLALYVNSDKVRILYREPTLLLLICPLLLYWITRVWMMAHRGEMHDDPVVFALKDPASYVLGFLSVVVIWFAT